MKKAFLIVTAVLLALAVVSCENPANQTGNSKPKVYYDKNGNAMIDLDLSVNVGKNRALHDTLAQAGSDYYEVIFVDNGSSEIYRTNWREGKTAKLRVKVGTDYDNGAGAGHGKAYIFAGRYVDQTLLGVGTIYSVYEGSVPVSPTATVVTVNATKVMFELEPLETTDPSDLESFPITAGSFDYSGFDPVPLTIDGKKVPAYQVLDNAVTNATFTLNSITTGLEAAFILNGTPGAGFKPCIWDGDTDVPPRVLDSITATFTPSTLVVGLAIDPRVTPIPEPGVCLIYFDIPLYLFNGGTFTNGKDPITWHLRGGLNNKLLDMGYASMSLGGAILLAVGDCLNGGPGSLIIDGSFNP